MSPLPIADCRLWIDYPQSPFLLSPFLLFFYIPQQQRPDAPAQRAAAGQQVVFVAAMNVVGVTDFYDVQIAYLRLLI